MAPSPSHVAGSATDAPLPYPRHRATCKAAPQLPGIQVATSYGTHFGAQQRHCAYFCSSTSQPCYATATYPIPTTATAAIATAAIAIIIAAVNKFSVASSAVARDGEAQPSLARHLLFLL